MRKMLRFTFSLMAGMMLCLPAQGQDTIMRIKGLRLGVDMSRIAMPILQPGRSGYEFSADFEAFKNIYPTVHFGRQTLELTKANYRYSSDGSYWRIGFEYNALKKIKYDQYEMAFLGFCYGFSRFTQSADSVYISDGHWGDASFRVLPEDFKADWVEFTAGVRAELFRNFFIGWYFSGRMMLWHTRNSPMVPIDSPGFGTIQKHTYLGFNYSVYYRIPLFKERYITPAKK